MGADTTILAKHNLTLLNAQDVFHKVGRFLSVSRKVEENSGVWYLPSAFFNQESDMDANITFGIPLLLKPSLRSELAFFEHILEFDLKETNLVFVRSWRSTLHLLSEYFNLPDSKKAKHNIHFAFKAIKQICTALNISDVLIYCGDNKPELEDELSLNNQKITEVLAKCQERINVIEISDSTHFSFDFNDYSESNWDIFNKTVFLFKPQQFNIL